MPNYTRTLLNTEVASMVSGEYDATKFVVQANRAVRDVLSEIDMKSTKRKSALTPNLFENVFQYTCPTDLKGIKIIDVEPQIDRSKTGYWKLTTEEEFDRYKEEDKETALIAISEKDFVKKLLLSKTIDDTVVTIDSLSVVGDWEEFGDGENLTADSSNYVKGSASINWDISSAGGTTAGIQNDSIDSFDISEFLTEGSIFVWVYITSTTNLTNFILRIGSSTSAYNYITITTNNEGTAFVAGWNLLRFDLVNKAVTGSPTNTACTYVAIYMTKDAAKVSETDYRFNDLKLRKGKHYNVIYYSKYGWQSAAGAYLENSTATGDFLNADTEEFNLISEKCAELVERNLLRNKEEANNHRQIYEQLKEKYVLSNPSEAQLLITTYWDF